MHQEDRDHHHGLERGRGRVILRLRKGTCQDHMAATSQAQVEIFRPLRFPTTPVPDPVLQVAGWRREVASAAGRRRSETRASLSIPRRRPEKTERSSTGSRTPRWARKHHSENNPQIYNPESCKTLRSSRWPSSRSSLPNFPRWWMV